MPFAIPLPTFEEFRDEDAIYRRLLGRESVWRDTFEARPSPLSSRQWIKAREHRNRREMELLRAWCADYQNPTTAPRSLARHHGPASASDSALGSAPLPGVDRAVGDVRALAGQGERHAAARRRALRLGAVVLVLLLGGCKGSEARLAVALISPAALVVAGALFVASLRNVQR